MQSAGGDRGRGVRRLAARRRRGEPYDRTDLTGPLALVLGSEAHGLPADVEPRTGRLDARPHGGHAESLNVGVTGAVVCFEAARQRRQSGRRVDLTPLDVLPDPVVQLDADRRIADANDAAGRLAGAHPRRACSASRMADSLRAAGTRAARPLLDGRLASVGSPPSVTRASPSTRSRSAGPDGDRSVRVTGRYERNGDGSVTGAVLVLRPPRRRPVGRADRQRGRVDGEPRAAQPADVGQGLHVAAAEPVGPAQGRPEADDARAGAPRRRPRRPGSITELLDISRLETGRLVLRRQRVDIAAAGRARGREGDASPTPSSTARSTFPADFPQVFADPDKVEQVLTNLVENAAKYASPTGMRVVGGCSTAAGRGRGQRHGRGHPRRRPAAGCSTSSSGATRQADRHRARSLDQPGSRRGPRRPAHGDVRGGQGSVFRFTLPTGRHRRAARP